jgi:hypothetical protein
MIEGVRERKKNSIQKQREKQTDLPFKHTLGNKDTNKQNFNSNIHIQSERERERERKKQNFNTNRERERERERDIAMFVGKENLLSFSSKQF